MGHVSWSSTRFREERRRRVGELYSKKVSLCYDSSRSGSSFTWAIFSLKTSSAASNRTQSHRRRGNGDRLRETSSWRRSMSCRFTHTMRRKTSFVPLGSSVCHKSSPFQFREGTVGPEPLAPTWLYSTRLRVNDLALGESLVLWLYSNGRYPLSCFTVENKVLHSRCLKSIGCFSISREIKEIPIIVSSFSLLFIFDSPTLCLPLFLFRWITRSRERRSEFRR